MHEDEIFRSSSQYRLWTFTPERLAALRAETNHFATNQVREALKRRRRKTADNGTNGEQNGVSKDTNCDAADANGVPNVDCLTGEEEHRLVGHYAGLCISLGRQVNKLPDHVIGSAVQFLRRFYLYNSPMTYHPKQIMPSCLHLATKTENWVIGLSRFTQNLQKHQPKTTAEDIIAPEFIITQGLRFTFDVRHPYRGLKGARMEMQTLANGKGEALPGEPSSAATFQTQIHELPLETGGAPKNQSAGEVSRRIEAAYARAKEILQNAALLTDAYFLYTPSQIMFASLHLADQPLAHLFLTSKIGTADNAFQSKVIAAFENCAAMLKDAEKATPIDELKRIDKKLYKCRNPEKMDLVGLNKAVKRDGAEDGKLDESVAKRRKLEREKVEKEGEDLFGPEIKKE